MSEEKESKTVEGPLGKILNNAPKPLRQPNCSGEEVSVASSDDKTGKEPEDVEQKNNVNKVFNSTLNVNAAEFTPQMYQPKLIFEDIEDLSTWLEVLRSELQYLALCPGRYDEILQGLYDVLRPFQSDEEVMKSVIDTILYECMTEENLCYTGTRLCSDLQKKFGGSFRTHLLSCCQTVYSNLMSNQDMYLDQVCCFGLVLAELYLKIDIQEKRIAVLGDAIFELLGVLLRNEGEKALKFICQILKLIGGELEENNEDSPEKMNDVFSRLRAIHDYVDLDPNLKLKINYVIQMKESNWSRERSQESSSAVAAVKPNGYPDDIVFFGPDGQVMTEEEKAFLYDNIPPSDDIEDYLSESESMNKDMY